MLFSLLRVRLSAQKLNYCDGNHSPDRAAFLNMNWNAGEGKMRKKSNPLIVWRRGKNFKLCYKVSFGFYIVWKTRTEANLSLFQTYIYITYNSVPVLRCRARDTWQVGLFSAFLFLRSQYVCAFVWMCMSVTSICNRKKSDKIENPIVISASCPSCQSTKEEIRIGVEL